MFSVTGEGVCTDFSHYPFVSESTGVSGDLLSRRVKKPSMTVRLKVWLPAAEIEFIPPQKKCEVSLSEQNLTSQSKRRADVFQPPFEKAADDDMLLCHDLLFWTQCLG